MSDATQSKKWKTVKQEADRIQASPETLYRAIRAGKLRAAKINGRRNHRLTEDWTDQWLEASATPKVVEIRRSGAA
jgi:excisionase family DNA binding protein